MPVNPPRCPHELRLEACETPMLFPHFFPPCHFVNTVGYDLCETRAYDRLYADYEDAWDDYYQCEFEVGSVVFTSYMACLLSTGGAGIAGCATFAMGEYIAGVYLCVNSYENDIQNAIDNYHMSAINCYLDNVK